MNMNLKSPKFVQFTANLTQFEAKPDRLSVSDPAHARPELQSLGDDPT